MGLVFLFGGSNIFWTFNPGTTLLSQGADSPLQVFPMGINSQYESSLLSEIQLQLFNLSQSNSHCKPVCDSKYTVKVPSQEIIRYRDADICFRLSSVAPYPFFQLLFLNVFTDIS